MNDPVNLDTLSDFVGGVSGRVPVEDDWGVGLLITGDTAAAGTAYHEGETMPRPKYERRLQEHRERHGPPAGAAPDTIRLNVVERESEPFPGPMRHEEGTAE